MSRILVVDDDPNIVRLVRSYLEQDGFTVLTAGNGALAQQMIRTERPDLVVLDLMLPDKDGLQNRRDRLAIVSPIPCRPYRPPLWLDGRKLRL